METTTTQLTEMRLLSGACPRVIYWNLRDYTDIPSPTAAVEMQRFRTPAAEESKLVEATMPCVERPYDALRRALGLSRYDPERRVLHHASEEAALRRHCRSPTALTEGESMSPNHLSVGYSKMWHPRG